MYDCFMQKLIYRKFILGTGGVENRKYLEEALKRGLGGVIFFTRDIDSREQFKDLTANIKSKAREPLFLSIDQEGGRVERTENIHARYLSPKFAYEKGEDFLRIQTEKIAHELKEYGINLNFAPCADVNTNPLNPIIGERAFSDNPEVVSKCVKIVSDIYRGNGIIPCLKHFPGHGDASKDSHLTLPVIDLPLGEMERVHIKPFKDNINAEMIMAAHLHCTCFDKDVIPASLSANAIGYLRNNTGGYLSAAVEIASTFLPSDSVVFYEEDKDKNITEVKTDDSYGQIEMDQIVILQNDQTASASEALIGALKSHLKDKVTLVGQTTYGKGTEQTTVPFEDGTSIKYTIARWLTPDKESIHEKGFEPDVAVEDTSIGSVSYTEMKEDDVIIADKVHVNASALQRFLDYLGYTVDRTDEYFSKTSSDSLKQFQKDQGIAPTGNCDYTTWEKILDMIMQKYNENSVNDDPIRNHGIELLG